MAQAEEQSGAQLTAQAEAQPGAHSVAQSETQSGAQSVAQPEAQSGAQSVAQAKAQSRAQSVAQSWPYVAKNCQMRKTATLGIGVTLNNPFVMVTNLKVIIYFFICFQLSTTWGSFWSNLGLILQILSAWCLANFWTLSRL